MKKLTKRVQAGGLWFDVPQGAQFVSVDEVGYSQSHEIKPAISEDTWSSGAYDCALGFVELEGADWQECCWYVGDQIDGEAIERREWVNELLGKFKEIENNRFNQDDEYYLGHQTGWNECLQSVRAGEVE